MPTLQNYTLTYDSDQRIQGWPSFYSYYPDWMIGMNNFFYTFYRGQLYRHNTEPANTFYGTKYDSTATTVFNTSPLENKLYKTVALQGEEAWSAMMQSEIQQSETVDSTWFEQKEGVWFAFVRNQDSAINYALRSVNGIGNSISVDSTLPAQVLINFPLTMKVSGIINIGDVLYYGLTPTQCGNVTAVNVDLQAGLNQLVVDTTLGAIPPTQTEFFLYVKNPIAESHGILGHYAVTTLTYTGNRTGELFAVQSDVMKSFP